MLLDTRTKLGFLDPFATTLVLVLLVLAQLVLVLAELKDTADGRPSRWSDLHQVEAMLLGNNQGLLGRHDAQHLALRSDYPDFRYADALVFPNEVPVMLKSAFPSAARLPAHAFISRQQAALKKLVGYHTKVRGTMGSG